MACVLSSVSFSEDNREATVMLPYDVWPYDASDTHKSFLTSLEGMFHVDISAEVESFPGQDMCVVSITAKAQDDTNLVREAAEVFLGMAQAVEADEADEAENTPYFAQIRAFLTDQYGEKSAVLTWLIPINSSYVNLIRAPKDFNPDMFVLGKSYV